MNYGVYMIGMTSNDLGPFFFKDESGNWVVDFAAIDADLARPEVESAYAALVEDAKMLADRARLAEVVKENAGRTAEREKAARVEERARLAAQCGSRVLDSMEEVGFDKKKLREICRSPRVISVTVQKAARNSYEFIKIPSKETLPKEGAAVSFSRAEVFSGRLKEAMNFSAYTDSSHGIEKLGGLAQSRFQIIVRESPERFSSSLRDCAEGGDTLIFLPHLDESEGAAGAGAGGDVKRADPEKMRRDRLVAECCQRITETLVLCEFFKQVESLCRSQKQLIISVEPSEVPSHETKREAEKTGNAPRLIALSRCTLFVNKLTQALEFSDMDMEKLEEYAKSYFKITFRISPTDYNDRLKTDQFVFLGVEK